MDLGLCHDSRFLQASVGKFARNRIARSISKLKANRKNGYDFRFICTYKKAGSAIGTFRLPSKTSFNPQQSANEIASFRNDRDLWGSPLNPGGFNFHDKVRGSPTRPRPIVPALGRGWYVTAVENISPNAQPIPFGCSQFIFKATRPSLVQNSLTPGQPACCTITLECWYIELDGCLKLLCSSGVLCHVICCS